MPQQNWSVNLCLSGQSSRSSTSSIDSKTLGTSTDRGQRGGAYSASYGNTIHHTVHEMCNAGRRALGDLAGR